MQSSRRSSSIPPPRRRVARRRGFTLVELMISSLLILIFAYGAGNAYLNYLSAKTRTDAKLRLQTDATQAAEQLAREFRAADSVSITGTYAAGSLTVGTYTSGTSTDAIYLKTVSSRKYLVHNTGSGERTIVPTPLDSLGVSKSGDLVQIYLRLADTTGNKVTTLASATLRN